MKWSPFAEDMLVYRENPNRKKKKILEQISELHKVTGYKINIKKQSYFFTLAMSM